MACIESFEKKEESIVLKIKITPEEYCEIGKHISNLLLLPAGKRSLSYSLTTGKLGNSNRVMVPKKLLKENKIEHLPKNVDAGVFEIDNMKYMLIRLEGDKKHIPIFED